VQLREGLREADLVVDIKKIPELTELSFSAATGLAAGGQRAVLTAFMTMRRLPKAYPALVDAAKIVGGWQIQSPCQRRRQPLQFVTRADTIPALIALGAVAGNRWQGVPREVPVESFLHGTWPQCASARASCSFPCNFRPVATAPASSAYERFIPRNEMDIAVGRCRLQLAVFADAESIASRRRHLRRQDPFVRGMKRSYVGVRAVATAEIARKRQLGRLKHIAARCRAKRLHGNLTRDTRQRLPLRHQALIYSAEWCPRGLTNCRGCRRRWHGSEFASRRRFSCINERGIGLGISALS